VRNGKVDAIEVIDEDTEAEQPGDSPAGGVAVLPKCGVPNLSTLASFLD